MTAPESLRQRVLEATWYLVDNALYEAAKHPVRLSLYVNGLDAVDGPVSSVVEDALYEELR